MLHASPLTIPTEPGHHGVNLTQHFGPPPPQQQYGLVYGAGPGESSHRRVSLSPSQARTHRNRTPIQHSRPSQSRSTSQSRSQFILDYAIEQLQPQQGVLQPSQAATAVIPSQSAPSTPQVPPVPEGYHATQAQPFLTPAAQGYFSAAQVEQMPDFSLQSDPSYFYQTARSASISAPAVGMSMQDVYAPPDLRQISQAYPSTVDTTQSFAHQVMLESSHAQVEVVSSRPKPQCWEHGCNGRQFSTFSNLLRHQREKSGSAMKATCPHCGTEFTRTTARNGHMYSGKCKGQFDQTDVDDATGPRQ